jgi:hypothetical protein
LELAQSSGDGLGLLAPGVGEMEAGGAARKGGAGRRRASVTYEQHDRRRL